MEMMGTEKNKPPSRSGSSASQRSGPGTPESSNKDLPPKAEAAPQRKKREAEPLPPNSLATVKGEAMDAAVGIPLGRDLGPMQLRNASVGCFDAVKPLSGPEVVVTFPSSRVPATAEPAAAGARHKGWQNNTTPDGPLNQPKSASNDQLLCGRKVPPEVVSSVLKLKEYRDAIDQRRMKSLENRARQQAVKDAARTQMLLRQKEEKIRREHDAEKQKRRERAQENDAEAENQAKELEREQDAAMARLPPLRASTTASFSRRLGFETKPI